MEINAEKKSTGKQSKPNESGSSPENLHHENRVTMKSNSDSGEIVLFQKGDLLVTNKRICGPDGLVLRLSDVQRAETQFKQGYLGKIAGAVSLLSFIGCIWFNYPHDTSVKELIAFQLFSLPFWIYYFSNHDFEVCFSVVAHCNNGVVTIATVTYGYHKTTWKQECVDMQAFHKAICQALANKQL
jgi:hypothetical protein